MTATHLSQSVNGSLDTITSSSLASLANAGYALSNAAINNVPTDGTTISYDLADLIITTTGSCTPTAGAYLTVWILPAVDGTNYPNPPGTSTAGVAPPALSMSFPQAVTGSAITNPTWVCPNIQIPPYNFYVQVQNNLGGAFPATVAAKLQRKTVANW
jgi:hypothetical protein